MKERKGEKDRKIERENERKKRGDEREIEREKKESEKKREIITKETYLFKLLQMFIVVGGIPEFEDISKTTETFWKETTYNKLIYGSDGGDTVKVYKDQGSAFIRCQYIDYFEERIHILEHDETISDGIYRFRNANVNTAIGSQYFSRSEREEGRVYRLVRYNESGNINYEDKILGKDDSGWRYLARYRFNPETLDWTQLEV